VKQIDLPDHAAGQARPPVFETLTLSELFPYWSNLLWLKGMRPMLQNMLQLDLTMSESIVLRQLQYQSLTIAEVAAYLSITHSAASRAVDRLVRDGFISRMENPVDRRQKLLTLTAQGAALVRDLESTFTAGVEFLAASLSAEEQEQFRLLLARVIAANCPAPHAAPASPDAEVQVEERAPISENARP
jgi:MarR family transcriptional regulator, organic hydroperoxide resistance regulator